MKKSITQALGMCTVVLMSLASCKKDEVQTVIQPGSAPTVTASANNVVLSQNNSSTNAITYTWTPVTFGYQAVVSYTLQFDKKGGDFSSPVSFSSGSATTKTLTVSDLNSVYQSKGLVSASAVPTATPVDVRVVASVGATAPSVISAVSSVTATPYAYCAQPTADKAWSIIGPAGKDWNTDIVMTYDCSSKTFTYTGPLNSGEFKFRYGGAWTSNLGGSASTGGPLTQNGPNLSVATTGNYTVVLSASIDGTGTASGTFTIK